MENKLIEWVKKEKKRLGISYRDIDSNCNSLISHVHIGYIVAYKQPISAKFVLGMSVAFNIPIWEAFYMAGMLPDEHKITAELLTKLDKLPPDRKKQILELVDMFSQKE